VGGTREDAEERERRGENDGGEGSPGARSGSAVAKSKDGDPAEVWRGDGHGLFLEEKAARPRRT